MASVVTLLDRDRRTVFPAGTELRRHEAIVAGGETGRYAGLRLIKAGPTGGATMQQVEAALLHADAWTTRERLEKGPARQPHPRHSPAELEAALQLARSVTIALERAGLSTAASRTTEAPADRMRPRAVAAEPNGRGEPNQPAR